jgi:hypothetical protein
MPSNFARSLTDNFVPFSSMTGIIFLVAARHRLFVLFSILFCRKWPLPLYTAHWP